jgi:hypothetical protein
MGNISLLQHEHEVERSRAKLTQDLAVLCSPKTLAAFTDDLKQEAFATRDDFWEKIKARAASNPAAVAAIGAGLAWRSSAGSLILGCSGPPSTSNKIIRIGVAFSLRQSGTVCSFGALAALRDPAPPASSLRWGFGGGGDGRCTTEGDPDDQHKIETQARITRKRWEDQDP